jgi:hypothetical protein
MGCFARERRAQLLYWISIVATHGLITYMINASMINASRVLCAQPPT